MRAAALRQIRPQRRGIAGIVEDQENAAALLRQLLPRLLDGVLFGRVRFRPAEPHRQPGEIGPEPRLGLRADPPRRAIFAAVQFGIARRQHRLADPAQPMQRRHRDPTGAAHQRLLDRHQIIVAPAKHKRHHSRRDVRLGDLCRHDPRAAEFGGELRQGSTACREGPQRVNAEPGNRDARMVLPAQFAVSSGAPRHQMPQRIVAQPVFRRLGRAADPRREVDGIPEDVVHRDGHRPNVDARA